MWVGASVSEVVGASWSQEVGRSVCLHPPSCDTVFQLRRKKLKCYLATCLSTVLTWPFKMLSLRGTLTRIIHVFSSEFLNVFTPLLRRRPRSLTFALWMPPTDGLRGRMQIRSDALLESLQWINCTDISYPFSCCSILGKRELRLAETQIMQEELYESLFCIFKKKVHIYFRCLEECCNAGLLWSSKKNKK